MSFRTRILFACLIVAVAPLLVFALGGRREVRDRLTDQFEARVATLSTIIRQDLEQQATGVDARIRALAGQLADGPELRAALLQRVDRARLLDYAPSVMPMAGLDYLLLLDGDGNVLSSGHFRNDYDRSVAGLPVLLGADGPVLVAARRPEGSFLALARAQGFRLGEREFVLAGGIEVDSRLMQDLVGEAGARALVVSLDYPGGRLSSGQGNALAADAGALRDRIALPFVDDVAEVDQPAEAYWTIAHSLEPLYALQRAMDARFAAAVVVALLLAVIGARLLAARVNRPLEELAAKTTRVNLDRLDTSFQTRRRDEIGTLSRMLDGMMRRLRASAAQLRAAERRATVGDIARQVNHDVRNGLLPIRNVIRHLTEVAEASPAALGTVFAERVATLQSGITYLENLATNYARLSSAREPQVCDVNELIRATLADSAADRAEIDLKLADGPVRVSADPVALRRVIENLAVNALESCDGPNGRVSVGTHVNGSATDRLVTITVSDTGRGIEPDALDRIFEDFYTTKDHGTGLGLSIVRRLVTDMDGRIRVESQPDQGSTFRVELPGVP